MSSRKFHFRIKKREYYQKYGREYDKPNLRNRITAFFISILPKIGPLKSLKFEPPGPEGEKLFNKSFDTVMVCYGKALYEQGKGDKLKLVDIDFDTGKPTAFGEYGLADQTYSQMVIYLDKIKFASTTSHLKQNILSFYTKADSTVDPPKKLYNWKTNNLALKKLKNKSPVLLDSLKFAVDKTIANDPKPGQ
jgi:hypothetical protein